MSHGGASLLEREAELAAIGEALERTSAGTGGQTLLIEGAPGIGKTTLLHELEAMAGKRGYRVLRARGSEIERDFGFGVVRQLLGLLLRDASAIERERLLSGPARLTASIFGLGDSPAIEGVPAEAPLYGLYWLLAALAESAPTVVAIDDAHWCDAASLRFIEYLGRRLEGVPLLIALAARPAEGGVQTEMLSRMRSELEPLRIAPPLLSEQSTATIVRTRLGKSTDVQVLDACHLATGGNPLLIEELLAELQELEEPIAPETIAAMGPRRIAESLIGRARSLAEDGPAILRALAVLGEGSQTRAIAQLAEVDPDSVAAMIDGLAEASILDGSAEHRFTHPLLGASVYEAIPAASREAMHARTAALLLELDAPVEEVAAHLLRCKPASATTVCETLELAAERAIESGAPDSAATYLRRALEETMQPARRGELVHRLARAEVALRDPAAIGHLQEAAQLASDPSRALEVVLELADVLALAGQWEAVSGVIEGGLAQLGEQAGVPGLLDLEAIRAAYWGYDPATYAHFEAERPRLLELVRDRSDVESRHLRWVLAAFGAIQSMPRVEVLELVGPVSPDWIVRRGGRESSLVAQALLALLIVGAYETGERMAAMLGEAGRGGSLLAMLTSVGYTAALEAHRARLDTSEASFSVVLELMRTNELSLMVLTTFLHFCLDTILERFALEEVGDLVEALEMPAAFGKTVSGALVLEVRAAMRTMRGERQAALSDLQEAELIYRPVQAGPRLSCWRSRLALALPAEQAPRALCLTAEELELARLCDASRAEGIALRTLGLLEGGEIRLARLRESVAVLRTCDSPLELARSLAELGGALRRANRRSEARDQLREALDLAQRCGAERLQERVREDMRVAGGKPRRGAISGPDSLTPAERRVATAAASGATNREIAQTLFVSLRTIEMHLTNTYRKLGDCSRADLAAVLGEPVRSL